MRFTLFSNVGKSGSLVPSDEEGKSEHFIAIPKFLIKVMYLIDPYMILRSVYTTKLAENQPDAVQVVESRSCRLFHQL